MTRALELAVRGRGRTRPNPMVGAVIVSPEGIPVAEGFHQRAGTPHAEAVALRRAGGQAAGATLYVNLEPCCHTNKRTPPCTEAIIAAGINRVVIGMTDPNPAVSGKGIRQLRKAGVAVRTGILGQRCERLNEAFSKHIRTGFPFVTLKVAATLDGKIATARGESQWITGSKARKAGHALRAEADAIVVGTETVLKDNPSLTCRVRGGRNPIRIIPDRRGRIPLSSTIFNDGLAPTWVIVPPGFAARRRTALEKRGVRLVEIPVTRRGFDLKVLMGFLGREGILHVMIEGGAALAASAIREQIVDRIWWFVAPRLIGGDGRSATGPFSLTKLWRAPELANIEHIPCGNDLLVRGDLRYPD